MFRFSAAAAADATPMLSLFADTAALIALFSL